MAASVPDVAAERFPADQTDNPYYLHRNDHAGLALVTDRLTVPSEFHSWRRSVLMALNVRNKLGFIDGSIPKPASTHRDYGAWSRCNDMVATWLMNSVSKKIGQSLLFINTAEGIWNNLMTRFKQDDAPRIFEIEQKLSKLEQGSMDVSEYYTELVTLWEEHKNYVDLPVCTCGKCECDAAALWEKLQQRSRVTKFLMGLNESFDQIRRHVLMLKPIPTIEEAFNIVTQDERQRVIKPVTRIDNVAFQSSAPSLMSQGQAEDAYVAAYNTSRMNQRPVCTHCGKSGHTIQKCFKIHGFPPGYKSHYKSQSKQKQSQTPTNALAPSVPDSTAKAIANVYSSIGSTQGLLPSASPHLTSGGTNMNLQNFTPQQIQNLIAQFNPHVRPQEQSSLLHMLLKLVVLLSLITVSWL